MLLAVVGCDIHMCRVEGLNDLTAPSSISPHHSTQKQCPPPQHHHQIYYLEPRDEGHNRRANHPGYGISLVLPQIINASRNPRSCLDGRRARDTSMESTFRPPNYILPGWYKSNEGWYSSAEVRIAAKGCRSNTMSRPS